MTNPYSHLPPRAFWRTGVADLAPFGLEGLWTPKFAITREERVITAGSCFAQHIGRALKARGFGWHDAEPAPPGLVDAARFQYGVFSFRTGNIYTTALLRQWLHWALERECPDEMWEAEGRWYDPFRPAIEPGGFASRAEALASRRTTLNAIRAALRADVFVFTLGLTEAWRDSRTGLVYAACPGTLAGRYDPARHAFVDFDYEEVLGDLRQAIAIARRINPAIRFLLTVSPVPLTATASGQHVLVGTVHSKSVLRAVAGRLAREPDVDYFPSYEIIASHPFRGMFYASNLREVVPAGVAHVMDGFFRDMVRCFPETSIETAIPRVDEEERDLVCEEAVLEAFNDA